MKVIPICHYEPGWNFSYIIHADNKEKCLLVDPGLSDKTLTFLKENPQYKVSHILITHKHDLHAGNLSHLVRALEEIYHKKLEVVSGRADAKFRRLCSTTIIVNEGEGASFEVENLKVTCIPAPCHTLGSLVYLIETREALSGKENDLSFVKKNETICHRCIFTGDTHFVGGCGYFMEGNARMMMRNIEMLKSLPKDTFIFPGHEYTIRNLKWAMSIEWENEAYEKKLKWAEEKRKNGEFTIPSMIEEEFEINIFWRTKLPILKEKMKNEDPVKVLSKLREMKNKVMSLKREAC